MHKSCMQCVGSIVAGKPASERERARNVLCFMHVYVCTVVEIPTRADVVGVVEEWRGASTTVVRAVSILCCAGEYE